MVMADPSDLGHGKKVGEKGAILTTFGSIKALVGKAFFQLPDC